MFSINRDKCVDCGYCDYVCPFGSLTHHVDDKYWEIDRSKCKACGICFDACIASAIECDRDQQVITHVEIGDKCVGCTTCARACPVGAIRGIIRLRHSIDQDKCIRCGNCVDACVLKGITATRTNVYDAKGRRKV